MADAVRSIQFQLSDRITGYCATIILTELDDGTILIEIETDADSPMGDLQGIFFDVSDSSILDGLQVTGADVTGEEFANDGVSNLGNGVNLNGEVVNSLGAFDAGVKIGKSGLRGDDDIQTTSFLLSHDELDLTLEYFAEQDFGLRVTSIGSEGGERTESVKLGGTAPELPDDPPPVLEDVVLDIDENAYVGAVVGAIVDQSGGTAVTYAIVGGNEAGAFEIDAATGEIKVKNRELLDYESGVTAYQLTIEATNSSGISSSALATIDINDRRVLLLEGTDTRDIISIGPVFVSGTGLIDGELRIIVNGVQTIYDDVEKIVINGYGDNDLVSISGNFTTSFLDDVAFEVTGGAGNDTTYYNANVTGSVEPFVPGSLIEGGEGNDTLSVGSTGGAHTLLGGNGNERFTLQYPDEDDFIDGGDGNDRVTLYFHNSSVDHIIDASSIVAGGSGNIVLNGDVITPLAINVEALTILDGNGDDIIYGGDGLLTNRDEITISGGNDAVYAGDGNDYITLRTVDAGDSVDGGDGSDFLFFRGGGNGETIDASVAGSFTYEGVTIPVINVERFDISGGAGDDTIIGFDNLNSGGGDVINPGSGTDTVFAGAGSDNIYINLEDVSLGDYFDGGTEGTFDSFRLGQFSYSNTANDVIDASVTGSLTVNGITIDVLDFEAFSIFSQGGADTITGSEFSDFVNGGTGNDTYYSTAGNDRYFDTTGDELFIFTDGCGSDEITRFDAGVGIGDRIDVSAFGFSVFDDGTANDLESAMTVSGIYTYIQLDVDDQVRVYNPTMSTSAFAEDDFIF